MTNRILAMFMVLTLIVAASAISTSRDAQGLLTQNVATPVVGGDATPQTGSSRDVEIGDTVVFVSAEGEDLATITVNEVIQPLTQFAEFFTPAADSVYIAIKITVENVDTDDDVFTFQTNFVGIQTGDGHYFPSALSVPLNEEATDTYPQLSNAPIAAGDNASGYLYFAIPEDEDAIRLFYSLPGHLLLLADLPAVEREAPSA